VKKIAVLISNKGTGTNLQAIIDACKAGEVNGKVVVVVSNAANAVGLDRARREKIPTEIFPWLPYKKTGKTRAAYSKDLAIKLKKYNPNVVVFAGWILILTKEFVDNIPLTINLHPGLIPDEPKGRVYFPNGSPAPYHKGKHTDSAISDFLKKGHAYAGSTLHVVTSNVDWGPVIERSFEKIKMGDSTDSLYSRLKKKEHQMLIRALKLFGEDRLNVSKSRQINIPKGTKINVLIIGGGGREHTLSKTYAKSKRVNKIFVVPGNGLMGVWEKKKVLTFPKIKPTDFSGIWEIVARNKISLVDVAQDDPLAAGGVDFFNEKGVAAFGPTRSAAQIEWDKDWARNFMKRASLPIPAFASFSSKKEAARYANKLQKGACFVKAAGLAAGKGAIKATNKREALSAIDQMASFGEAGETFLIEEALYGEEFSAYAICDGKNFKILKCAQDNKAVYNFDEGANTGGMGAVAPALVTKSAKIKKQIEKIFEKAINGLVKEGRPYKGILYLGGIITKSGIKIIEFNARWGDPEAQVVLPAIMNDYLDIVSASINGRLDKIKIQEDSKTRVCVVGASRGYPGDYSRAKNKKIFDLEKASKSTFVAIYGAGIEKKGKSFFTAGGRVFNVVAEGKDIIEARNRAYGAIANIFIERNNLHYRTDIGSRDVERKLTNA
jgi:phosphoribosylamine--glycine ligase